MLIPTGLLLSLVMVIAVVQDARGALRLGRIETRAQPGRGRRYYAVAVILLLGAALVIFDTGVPLSPALQVLAPAVMLTLLTPGLRDTALGEHGVRSSWYVRRFEELEEWRLTGEHLRWKLHGDWQAVAVPAERLDALRTTLETVAGDRESRFRH